MMKNCPQCPVCESREYELRDGNYFCVMCSTQSQELGLEKVVDEDHLMSLGMRRGTSVSITGSQPSQGKKNRKKESWERFSTAEAYTHLLALWIDDLERLGINGVRLPALQLWSLYLKRIGAAFKISRKGEKVARSAACMSYRDRWNLLKCPARVLGPTEIGVLRKRKSSDAAGSADESEHEEEEAYRDPMEARKRRRKQTARRTKFYRTLSENSVNSGNSAGQSGERSSSDKEDVGAGDSVSQAASGSEDEMALSDYNTLSEISSVMSRVSVESSRTSTSQFDPTRLRIVSLRAVFVLATIAAPESGLCTSDLAYLLSSNLVSYWSSHLALPPNWRLTINEHNSFTGGSHKGMEPISEEELCFHVFRMASFIGFKHRLTLVTRRKTATILQRYLHDLALPSFLLDDIRKTFWSCRLLSMTLEVPGYDLLCKKWRQMSLPSVSTRLLALLLIAMKYHFGLDDVQEYYHSHNAKKLNAAASCPYVPNFDILSWLQLSRLRLDHLMGQFPFIRSQYRLLSHIGTPDASLASLEETRSLYDSCLQTNRSRAEPAARYEQLSSLLSDLATTPSPPVRDPETRYSPLAEKTDILLRENSCPQLSGRMRTLLAMRQHSLQIYLHKLERIQGIYADGDSDKSEPGDRVERLVLADSSGLLKSSPITLSQAGSCGLLEPSGRPLVLREISQPFVEFDKHYWMSALRMDHRRHVGKMVNADRLQVLPDNYVWLLMYFSCYASLNPLELETEVVRIEAYINSLQPGFFGREIHSKKINRADGIGS